MKFSDDSATVVSDSILTGDETRKQPPEWAVKAGRASKAPLSRWRQSVSVRNAKPTLAPVWKSPKVGK